MPEITRHSGVENSVISPQDMDFLEVLKNNETEPINNLIPDDIEPAQLARCLQSVGRLYDLAKKTVARMKPFFGRVLLLYKNHPDLYQSLGYKNWDDWMTHGVWKYHGVSRSEAFDCVLIAERLGFLPANQLQELGIGRAKYTAKAIGQFVSSDMPIEMQEQRRQEWIQAAENTTVRGLKQLISEKASIPPGDFESQVVISFHVTQEDKTFLDEVAADPMVHEYVGSKDPGAIFMRAAQESYGEWRAQINYAIQQQANGNGEHV